jgi:hypothetical protein
MSRLKELIGESAVHSRTIDIRTHPLDDGRLVVEGRLKDNRLVSGYQWNGKPRRPGVVHWMLVRLLVGDRPPTILDAEAEMPGVPHEECPRALAGVKKIVGIAIAGGYSGRVLKRLGGVRGCAHLTQLIVAMGPAALHGYWAQLSRRPRPVPRSFADLPEVEKLINSCLLWKEDGPLLREIR